MDNDEETLMEPQHQALGVEQLPEEVLSAIWNLLPESDLLTARLVCKRWATSIKLPFGILSRTSSTLQLLSNAIFRKVDTLRLQDCPDELPIHVETKEVIPTYVRRLEIGGDACPEGVQKVMDKFSGQVQELSIRDCALAWIEWDRVGAWGFQNLKSLEIQVFPAPSSCWMVPLLPHLYESHLTNLEQLFYQDYPKLHVVTALFEGTNKWQHAAYNNDLLPFCIQEFSDFFVRHANTLKKFDVKEIISGKHILERLDPSGTGLLQHVDVQSCIVDMEPLKNYGVPRWLAGDPSESGISKLARFEGWVRSVPKDDLEYVTYTFEYTSSRATTSSAGKQVQKKTVNESYERISANLRITVSPTYRVRQLMLNI